MMEIICPKCGIAGKFSLSQSIYHGPYRCWKCRELFTIDIENDELKSCEYLSQEDYDKQQEQESLKAKFKQQ